SAPSRLAPLAPQDEDVGSGGATPHLEVAAQRSSKDEELLQLAAWIDGRLDGAEAVAVEARLADDPHSLELMLAAEQALGLVAPWPKRAQARAAAIIAPARVSLRVLAAAV